MPAAATSRLARRATCAGARRAGRAVRAFAEAHSRRAVADASREVVVTGSTGSPDTDRGRADHGRSCPRTVLRAAPCRSARRCGCRPGSAATAMPGEGTTTALRGAPRVRHRGSRRDRADPDGCARADRRPRAPSSPPSNCAASKGSGPSTASGTSKSCLGPHERFGTQAGRRCEGRGEASMMANYRTDAHGLPLRVPHRWRTPAWTGGASAARKDGTVRLASIRPDGRSGSG